MSGQCSRDAEVSARVTIGRRLSKKSRSDGSEPVNGSPWETTERAGRGRRRGSPDEVLLDRERSSRRERAFDTIAPAALIGIGIVRVEKHPPAGLIAGE